MIRRLALSPMLMKELWSQLRGSRAALLISLYVGLALISLRLLYGIVVSQLDYGAPLLNAQIGQVLFIGVSMIMQMLTIFLTPAVTVNAISQEHERGTMELIRATPLSGLALVGGKLIAAFALVLLLILATGPAFTMILLFGGVELVDLWRVLSLILVTALLGCSFGLCCSAITRQTYSATVLCYALLISLVGGTLFMANTWSLLNGLSAAPPQIVAANPLSAMATALAPARPPEVSFTGGFRPLIMLSLLSRGVIDSGDGAMLPTYRTTIMIYGGLTILCVWVALLAVRTRPRPSREDVLMLVALLAYGLLVYLLQAWWLPGITSVA